MLVVMVSPSLRLCASFWSMTDSPLRRACYFICAACLAAIVVHPLRATLHHGRLRRCRVQDRACCGGALLAFFRRQRRITSPKLSPGGRFIANYNYSLYLCTTHFDFPQSLWRGRRPDGVLVAILASNSDGVFFVFLERTTPGGELAQKADVKARAPAGRSGHGAIAVILAGRSQLCAGPDQVRSDQQFVFEAVTFPTSWLRGHPA